MITRTASRWQTPDWQSDMKNANYSLGQLCELLDIELEQLDDAHRAAKDFPLRVPPAFLANIKRGDPNDPLLLQILPIANEVNDLLFYETDPLQEKNTNPISGLLHKYQSRVLLITNPACAIHCRYCFRRHFPYSSNTPGQRNWKPALDYIAADPSIREVILSGGDPLASNDSYLDNLLQAIDAINHVDTVRIHTRIPTCLPSRITDTLLEVITHFRFKLIFVLHINHANELAGEALEAIATLQAAGIRLLNQSVLLKGVNDNIAAQQALINALHHHNIQAYYLHMPDKVKGTSHFAVQDKHAIELYSQLMDQNPGYMLPKLVRENPGEKHKNLIPIVES